MTSFMQGVEAVDHILGNSLEQTLLSPDVVNNVSGPESSTASS